MELAYSRIPTGSNPTLSTVMLALRVKRITADVTKPEVIAACKRRGVRIREGRVRANDVGNIYFGVLDGRVEQGAA